MESVDIWGGRDGFALQASIYYPDVLLIVVSEGDVALFLFPVGRGQRVEDVDASI